MKKTIFILLILFTIQLYAEESYNWDFTFRINASFMKVSLHNENNNPAFTGLYGNNDITSWLLGSKFVLSKKYPKSYLRNTLIAKYGETNNSKSTDELYLENIYRFLFKHIDSYFASEIKTVFKEFSEPNIYKLSAGASKTFIDDKNTTLESRMGIYGQKQFSPKLNTVTGIELITEYTRILMAFNRFESKAELYSDFNDLSHILLKWDNTFISKISEAFSIEFNYLMFYETKPKDYDNFVIYDKISSKRTAAISIVYDFK